MRRALTLVCLVVLSLLASSSARAQESFSPIAGWDNQVFPSFVISTATLRMPEDEQLNDEEADVQLYGHHEGVLGVEIVAPADDTPFTVTIAGNAILEESTLSGVLETEGVTYRIFPKVRYKYDALVKTKQVIPLAVTFEVELGDDEEAESEEFTSTVTLRSINDCPFAISDGAGGSVDISFMFAAYVNEQHPFCDKVLREALDSGIVDAFTGYQSGDPAEVYRQVFALWNALCDRDVRYSNITTSAATTDMVASQHVRLIDESINNKQANCVDGSVLLASLLRKIDIEPLLVYVPGHCYLAFYLDAEHTQLVGLETTLIGGAAGDDGARELPQVENVVNDEWRGENSWGTFCAAVAMGNADLEENKDQFNKDDADYQLVSIAAARAIGVLPIAFDASTVFEGVQYDEAADADDESDEE